MTDIREIDISGCDNQAIVSHFATQQMATTVNVKKQGAVESLLQYLGFANDKKDQDGKTQCVSREKGTLIMLLMLLIVFLISITGFFIMWFTEMYNDSILSKLLLIKNTTAVEWWQSPPLDPYLKIHIFNYTNADRFIQGLDKKLKVKDLGPYVYIEKFEKINVTFNNNYTISYRERRSYEFQPQLSGGKQYDQIIIPNIPMLTAAAKIKNINMFAQMAVNTIFQSTSSKPFKLLSADSFIWGYDDPLIEMSKSVLNFNKPLPFDKFGMLATRNGTSKDVLTIFSGENDIRKLAIINNFNGSPKQNLWATDECNRVDGTDGSQFPPQYMDKKHPLYVFIKAFCRKFPLVYDSEVNIFDGVPAWRYKAPLDVFSHPSVNPANQCFCDIESGTCPPGGVFNVTKCYDAPIMTSFPHFFTGEELLFKNIEGLEPDEKKHRTYADIHPRLAFPIDGASRFQINVQVHKVNMISDLNRFEDKQILPVLWMEVISGELSEELRTMIYHSTFSANAIQLSLRYGSLLLFVTTLAMIVAAFYYRNKNIEQQSAIKLETNQVYVTQPKDIHSEQFS